MGSYRRGAVSAVSSVADLGAHQPVARDWADSQERAGTWAQVLADMRADTESHAALARAHARDEQPPGTGPVRTWRPPAGLGPIPPDLREEALQVLGRQLEVAEQLTRAITVSRRQQQMLDRIDGGTTPPPPAYLDTTL